MSDRPIDADTEAEWAAYRRREQLRDALACAALHGMAANRQLEVLELTLTQRRIAACAYALADAMLLARGSSDAH